MCAALCLAGCGTYKSYTAPTVVGGMGQQDGALPDDTAHVARLPWRELFADKCLRSLIDSGLANNSDLQIASLRIREAEASLKAARLAFLPGVSLAAQGQVAGYGGDNAKTYSLALSANWEVDVAGRLANARRGAQATLAMYRDARQAVRTQLVATIANSYYNLLALDAQMAINRSAMESWRETLRTLQLMERVGESNAAAVAQAKAGMLAVEMAMATLGQQVSEQENALSVLMGATPGRIVRNGLSEQAFPDSLSAGVSLALLSNRPDVRQAEQALKAAFYDTQVARAAFYPQLTLGGTLGWANSDGAVIANPGKWLTNALASLTQPVFARGQLAANLEVAKARQEEACVAFRRKLLDAGAEVNNALAQWQTAQRRLAAAREQIAALEEAVRSTRLLMLHSESASYLEVLTAQQTLLQAQTDEVLDVFAKIQGIISLYHALGGGEL